MKIIRLKYITENGCTFKFINRNKLKDFVIQEKDGKILLQLKLKTSEEILLKGYKESLELFNQRWNRFENSEDIFFDLSDFEH